MLQPQRLRQVPPQFSWIDQALVQRHLIDHLDAPAAALYLFLLTVADAQGLSYYGCTSLMRRLHLSEQQLAAARQQLIELELVAYEAPLYQVLAIGAGTAVVSPAAASTAPASTAPASTSPTPTTRHSHVPLSLADLLGQLERRRGRL